MKIIIETKEELEQYKEVKIDGSLVAEEGECQQYMWINN